jgi:hypothetical protein
MFTPTTGRAPRLNAGARRRRITAALAVAVGGMLAWAAAIPAASAAIIPVPSQGGGYGPGAATSPAALVPTIVTGGMPGWQITLIAVAARPRPPSPCSWTASGAPAGLPPPPDDTRQTRPGLEPKRQSRPSRESDAGAQQAPPATDSTPETQNCASQDTNAKDEQTRKTAPRVPPRAGVDHAT